MVAAIQHLRSLTTGHVPSSLADGQIAINMVDGLLFWKDSGGTIRSFNLLNTVTADKHGAVRLTRAGNTTLQLDRYNGGQIIINGSQRQVGSTSPTVSVSGLTAGTIYYIYAAWSGSAVTIEASTTGYVTDTATGLRYKSGDATRTYVGMARPIAGPAWADSATQRLVCSWFNPRPRQMYKSLIGNKTTTNAAGWDEIDSSSRLEWLCHAGNGDAQLTGASFVFNSGSFYSALAIGIGNTTPVNDSYNTSSSFGTTGSACGVKVDYDQSTDGYQYATLLGSVSGGTGTFQSATTSAAHGRTSIGAIVFV